MRVRVTLHSGENEIVLTNCDSVSVLPDEPVRVPTSMTSVVTTSCRPCGHPGDPATRCGTCIALGLNGGTE